MMLSALPFGNVAGPSVMSSICNSPTDPRITVNTNWRLRLLALDNSSDSRSGIYVPSVNSALLLDVLQNC